MFPAVVTLRGIEDYWNQHDGKSIFENIVLPNGISKDILVPFIITRAADFPLMQIEPNYLQQMTTLWFQAHYDNFEKWIEAVSIEYDPLYNYDRDEKEDIARSGSHTGTASGSSSGSNSSQSSSSLTSTTTKAAFNSSSYEPYDKTVSSGSGSGSGSNNEQHSDTNSGSESGEEHRRLIIKGNIGTMTTQDMLNQELEVRKWNIYEAISEMYCLEFCVPIY